MKTFYGIVEDRQDPLKIGRVRVRCHGIHTANKQLIATPDLPWLKCYYRLPLQGYRVLGHNTDLWKVLQYLVSLEMEIRVNNQLL